MKEDFGSDWLRAEDLIRGGLWSEMTLTVSAAHKEGTVKIKDGKETIDKEVFEFAETDQKMAVIPFSFLAQSPIAT